MDNTPSGVISVDSTPVKSKPATPPQSVFDVKVLLNGSGDTAHAFQQFTYSSVKLPVQNATGDRNIDNAGCGLCVWTSFLAAAGCKVPTYDPTAKTFSMPAGAPTVDPPSLLQYLINYAASQTSSPTAAKAFGETNLFGPNNAGAIIHGSAQTKAAVDQLVTLSNPGTAARLDNSISSWGAATGTDLPQVTAGLQAGNPSVLVVCFPSSACTKGGDHQVLAIGIAKIGKATYYVLTNSGHAIYDPLPALQSGGYITAATLNNCVAGMQRANVPYAKIYRYRVLGGLQSVTGFKLTPLTSSK